MEYRSEPSDAQRAAMRGAPGETSDLRGTPGPDDAGARDRSIGSLLKELRDETTTLLRQEVALAKAEMSEKARTYGRNTASIGVGAAILLTGLVVLLLGASAALYVGLVHMGLSHYVSGWLAPLIVGGVTALIGYGLMQKGISTLRNEPLVPEKTIESLKEDKQWLKNKTA